MSLAVAHKFIGDAIKEFEIASGTHMMCVVSIENGLSTIHNPEWTGVEVLDWDVLEELIAEKLGSINAGAAKTIKNNFKIESIYKHGSLDAALDVAIKEYLS